MKREELKHLIATTVEKDSEGRAVYPYFANNKLDRIMDAIDQYVSQQVIDELHRVHEQPYRATDAYIVNRIEAVQATLTNREQPS